jgi:hypothetical protein
LVLAAAAVVRAGVLAAPTAANAAVEHGVGFHATVDGYRSWYGSYRLGDLGDVWCVDHGIAAPDVVLGYEPTDLGEQPPEIRRAVAWAVGRHGPGADRVTAAALMLVLHDLMGAVYPSGPLDDDLLADADLDGFGGAAADVLQRARLIKADALGRAHLVGPLALSVTAAGGEVAGMTGALRATLLDANGQPLEGVEVHPTVEGAELVGEVDRSTGVDGVVEWPFVSGPGENRFAVTADVPGAELVALRPTVRPAQRVAHPAGVLVQGSIAFTANLPRTFSIQKRGDAAELPVAGARFTVSGVDGELVVGADGRTPPITLLPGTYTVTEVAPPPGYDADGPWEVTVNDADVVFDVLDRARRGELVVTKVDAVTGESVTGATFEVRPAGGGPAVDPAGPLLVGRYEVRELVAPPHYRRNDEPVVVEVRAGERTEVPIPNQPLATVAFAKHPPLAGATFAVTSPDGGDEVGRCTTGTDGACALEADALDAHARYCWTEVEAPAGWGLGEGGCVTAGAAGSVTTIHVDEPALPPPAAPQLPAAAPTEAAPPPPTPPADAPPPAPVAPERPVEVLANPPLDRSVPELPRTGLPLQRVAALGLGVLGIGLLLCAAGRAPRSARASGAARPRRARRAPVVR